MNKEDIDRRVFETAFALWTARGKILDTRRRLKRYTYGDQWGDTVYNEAGQSMVESELIKLKGRRPITNNLIRRLVKIIVGRYRDLATQNEWYADAGYHADELLEELDSRLLEEFLISGMGIQRVADDEPLHGRRPLVTNVNPEAFFCNDFTDPRGYDIDMVGMLHDMSPAQVMIRFGGNKTRCRQIAKYLGADNDVSAATAGSARQFFTGTRGRHRIIEVWTREYTGRGAVKWRARWYTPSGTVLDSYLSPWQHGRHPFALKFYPLTDGEIHSFVEDIVDQQRHINRLIVLIDSILKTSAKGVLIFPQSQLTEDFPLEKIKEVWAKPGGVIKVKGQNTLMPQQISASGGEAGAYRLLEMELKLFEQTSGVGSALLGATNTGTGLEHYRAQVENATIALADIFRTFRSLVDARDQLLSSL